MAIKVTNNATSVLAASINTSATLISVAGGDAALFPTFGAGDWCPLTIVDSSGNREIVRATARTGANITVARAQEGTIARAFPAGARVDLRVTAAIFDNLTLDIAGKADATATSLALAGKADESDMTTALAAKMDKAGGTFTGAVNANGLFTFSDPTTNTKKFKFDAAGITAGQTRTLTLPDRDVTIRENVWETISTVTISGNPSVLDFTNLGAYTRLRLSGHVWSSADNNNLAMLFSTDNGATFPAPANSYTVGYMFLGTTGVLTAAMSSAATYAFGGPSMGNSNVNTADFVNDIFAFNKAALTTNLCVSTSRVAAGVVLFQTNGQAVSLGAVACNALRLYPVTGTLSGGIITLEGIKG